jgi:hypothetical protein
MAILKNTNDDDILPKFYRELCFLLLAIGIQDDWSQHRVLIFDGH